MGIKQKAVMGKTEQVEIDVWGDGSQILNVWFRPGVYTRGFQEEVQSTAEELTRIVARLTAPTVATEVTNLTDLARRLQEKDCHTEAEELLGLANVLGMKELTAPAKEAIEQELESKKADLQEKYDARIKLVIADWDYLDEDDKPMPICVDTVHYKMPDWLVDGIWDAIREKLKTPKAISKTSSAPSSTGAAASPSNS